MKIKDLLESFRHTEYADEVKMRHALNALKINGWKLEDSGNTTVASLRDIKITIIKTGNTRSNGDFEYKIQSNEPHTRIT